jgi:carboxylate-amine ligase
VAHDRWPTVGPAPVLDTADYEELADSMVTDGTVADRAIIYWYARPCEHMPTLEIRIADADLDTTLLAAVLLRGLATTLLAESRAGRDADPQPTHQPARYALRGLTHDYDAGHGRTTLAQGLQELAHHAQPGLQAADDLDLAAVLLTEVLAPGTGAYRQRADFCGGRSWADVVDGLAIRTARHGAMTSGRRRSASP